MKKTILALLIILIVFIFACTTQNQPVACTQDAKICPDGSAVGRISPNCEFAPCPESNTTKCDFTNDEPKYISMNPEECSRIKFQCELSREPFFDECGCGCKLKEFIGQDGNQNATQQQNFCAPQERDADVCAEIYDPVCGLFDPDKIACVRYPCARTFSNSCFACMEDIVLYWTEGECPG